MTTLLDLARAVQEACAKVCDVGEEYDTGQGAAGMGKIIVARLGNQCADAIRSLDLSSLLAQFDDVVVVPKALPVEIMAEQCGSEHPDDYGEVQRTWLEILQLLAAYQEQRHD